MSDARSTAAHTGRRSAGAFVLIGSVVGLAGARSVHMSLFRTGDQPDALFQAAAPPVTFDIMDRHGVPMALSVERLELVMSPNAMWQAHTPEWMAAALARVLAGTATPEALLERMLPDARAGIIRVDREPLLLDAAEARAVHTWIQTGSTDPGVEPKCIEGISIVPTRVAGEYTLEWKPRVVLSERVRAAHGYDRPMDWSRRIADDLIACLHGAPAPGRLLADQELKARRRDIWDALMPTQFKSVIKEVPAAAALDLYELLKHERVHAHQMELRRHAERIYPVQGEVVTDPPVAVLGRWGTLEPKDAERQALAELELGAAAELSDASRDLVRARTAYLVYQPTPRSGLELLCDQLLSPESGFAFAPERASEKYAFLAMQAQRQPLQHYFKEVIPASETPHVITTLDLELQRQTRVWLERVLVEHQPALAMAIAIEVATGKVLAVDAVDPYGVGGFLPTLHTFTPGSTMKVVIMATALDEGVITPESVFDACGGNFKIDSRAIREAEGPKRGKTTAAEGLAYSINAVLVQIGTRVAAETLRQRFLDLGYAQIPHSGLGGERAGMVPKLPWKRAWSHASVCFGHELFVTLWQHAAALCTVVRGGTYRPLVLVEGVEQYGVLHPLPLAPARTVFGAEACREVREMMDLGAREGTGKKVYCPDILMGTKTGTAQKVGGEICLHAELKHNREHGCRGASACRKKLAGQHEHRGLCYTSSMCVFGRLPGSEREVMVLVVVEEPRGGKKFGGDVAGPAAMGILQEALGYTAFGERVSPSPALGFKSFDAEAVSGDASAASQRARAAVRADADVSPAAAKNEKREVRRAAH